VTYRNVRIIMGDRITVLSARHGAHLVVGDRSEPARTLELGERDRPVWCTVTVHAPESVAVGAELTRGPGRPPGPGGRRTVDIRFRLTQAEAERLGLAGEDRHERARERLVGGAS
jgi:hypothetical protein